MKLLALEVSTEACSVALLVGQQLRVRHEEIGRGHAERVLPLIDELLRDAALELGRLDAIAFGRGPGGFTGVRLGASVAQGLAFGAGLPVVPVSTLRAVAQSALELDPGAEVILVCNDARMQEVYWAAFERDRDGLAQPSSAERVGPPVAVDFEVPPGRRFVGAGRGFAIHPVLAERYGAAGEGGSLQTALLPQATAIARLAAAEVLAGRVRPAREALPVYVRDDVVRPPSPRR